MAFMAGKEHPQRGQVNRAAWPNPPLFLPDRRFGKPALAGLHHKCLIKGIPIALYVACRRSVGVPHIVTDQSACDAKLHIGFQLFVIIYINLRDQSLEALLENQEVQVCRTIIVTAGCTHKIADRAVNGNWVARGLHAPKTEMTLRIGSELSAQIHWCLLGILLLVEALRRRVPYVDFRIGDRLSCLILDPAIDKQCRSRGRRTHNRTATFRAWRIHSPEWPKQVRSGFGLPVVSIVEQTNERREAERARHQNNFVVLIVGLLPEPRDVLDRLLELVLGEVHVARKGVQMLD